jgi:multicomponent Na+:H+ antiporter subunit D
VIDISEHLPALQVVVPMLSAGMVMLLRPRGLAWAAATAVSIFAFAIAIALTLTVLEVERQTYLMGSWAAPYGIELAVDAFSALLLLIVTGASSLALLVGYRSLDAEIETERQPFFYASCSWKSRRSRATCWSRVGRTGVR